MDKETYGIKLGMDLTDFNKGIDEAQEAVKDFETRVRKKARINNPFVQKYDFTGMFANLDESEIEKRIKEQTQRVQKLAQKALKGEYTNPSESAYVIGYNPEATEKEIDNYEKEFETLNALKQELYDRHPFEGLTDEERSAYQQSMKDEQKQMELMNMTVGQVKARIIELSAYKQKLASQPALNENEQRSLQETNEQLQKYTSLLERLGVKVPKIKPIEDGTTADIKETNNELEKTSKSLTAISVKTSISGGAGLSKMFTRATKSLKRFALSLFGIRSIWAMLSRGVRTYMAQNEKLKSTMQGIWSAFGTLMAPVAELVANVFLKVLGYINEMTKALFGFNFIAKSNQAIMEKYNKQLAKSHKALSGFDEINNLTQNQDEGPQGIIDEDKLGLNEDFVKKLQDISYWLKDNWDWLKLVAEALALAFGIGAITNWVKNIGKLLGVAGVAGKGGAGLLGLASTLGWIAGLGVLAVEIYIAYKMGKDMYDADQEYIEASQDFSNSMDKTTDTIIKQGKQGYKKGSVEQNKYITGLQNEISANAKLIKDNQDKLTSYGLIEGTIKQINGTYDEQISAIEEAENRIDELIDAYREQYEQGNLTADQEAYYLELLDTRNEMIKRTGTVYSTFTKNYQGLTEDNIKMTMDFNNGISTVETSLVRGAGAGAGALASTGIVIDDIRNRAGLMGNAIQNAVNGPYIITINSILNPPDTRAYINALNDVIWRLNQNDAARMIATGSAIGSLTTMALNRIPYLSIGTDLVRSEGLAYLHAGERVVPADVVGGGYSSDSGETNSLLRELIETVQNKNFTANITRDEVGRASVDYIRNQNRIMGGSVI